MSRISTVPLARTPYVQVATVRLEVVAGPDAGKGVSSTSEQVTVGTAAGNALELSDETVSGYHLELTRLTQGVRVVDLGSTNGTWLRDARIERAVVPLDTELTVGRTRVRLIAGTRALVDLDDEPTLGGLIGHAEASRRMMARLRKVSQTDVEVLLTGESGTGKEVIARALHESGPRASGPFVTVDCGVLVPTLVASELFGHERGAFTGADRQQAGAFEQAHGGTILLDEIGELPPELQTALLGVLERRTFRRVGGNREVATDVRIIAATHRDLRADVNEGRFRLDLFYRLAVVAIDVPPLRDRVNDIPPLVEHFLRLRGYEGPVAEIVSDADMDALRRHPWPGNVRELRNMVEASLAMGEWVAITRTEPSGAGKLAPALEPLLRLPYRDARNSLLRAFEQQYLDRLLAEARGNVSRAARTAKMDRSHLFDLLCKHGLR